ncbi:hypothetical protein F5Y08DRAFT_101532 [Xylaria arbuscula]|nr:hypothetical protein F5Y08DRAFT_101532 [Xylaria arbuscula]
MGMVVGWLHVLAVPNACPSLVSGILHGDLHHDIRSSMCEPPLPSPLYKMQHHLFLVSNHCFLAAAAAASVVVLASLVVIYQLSSITCCCARQPVLFARLFVTHDLVLCLLVGCYFVRYKPALSHLIIDLNLTSSS